LSLKSYPNIPPPNRALNGPRTILSGVPINNPKFKLSSSTGTSPKGYPPCNPIIQLGLFSRYDDLLPVSEYAALWVSLSDKFDFKLSESVS